MKPIAKFALAALAFTYLFFFEYVSPFRWVHISYDLDGYHYPLMDYGFLALKQGRFPQWDITYSGISYAGNPQAALLYPGTWILWAVNWPNEHLSYSSLQSFDIAHLWLAAVLGYLWLRRGRRLSEAASLFGAMVLAFSGFACSQLQHLGLIVAYAWTPLALWGIDEAANQGRWQPLRWTALASALAFLGGYTPSWLVLVFFAAVYGLCQGWRVGFGAVSALVASLFLAMVQLLPTAYLVGTKIPDYRYGGGLSASFFISYLIPNFYDHAINVAAGTNWPNEYVYLGAPGLLGLGCALYYRRFRVAAPLWTALALCLILFLDPLGLVGPRIEQFVLLRQVCRSFYFAAGIAVALAGLCAHGLDAFFEKPRPTARWLLPVFAIGALTWAAVELARWRAGSFAPGWSYEVAITLALFAAGAWVFPNRPMLTGALLLLTAAADYKAFGTSKRFNASPGAFRALIASTGFAEMDDQAYREMKLHPGYRVLADVYLNPVQLRHFGLATPQGFDPFLPALYERDLRTGNAEFRSNWEFDIDPANTVLLHRLGIRYWITTDASPLYPRLKAIARFRELGREPRYFRVFEDTAAPPVFTLPGGSAQIVSWTPERRTLRVNAGAEGAMLQMAENLVPGWSTSIDQIDQPFFQGGTAPDAFQTVPLPPGNHTVEFRYQTQGLIPGAAISLLSLAALFAAGRTNART